MDIKTKAMRCKAASFALMTLDSGAKDKALLMMADALRRRKQFIISANARDVADSEKKGIPRAMVDRLILNEARVGEMADGLSFVASLPDPVGGADEVVKRPNGLMIEKRRVPLGVVGVIYESRPNVTADAAGICLKSGNAVLLRGGSDAIHSNIAIVDVLNEAIEAAGLPAGCIELVDDTSRETAQQMMRLNGIIDVLIPRGGASLIRSVVENATIPIIETGTGNCHAYVDDYADMDKAAKIVYNAKCSRPSTCNAIETLLIARSVTPELIKRISDPLRAKGVEVRGDAETCALLPWAIPATAQDWYEEYNDYILAVKVVDGLDEAIAHINAHNTKHSETIITENYTNAHRFLNEVDAAAVYVNASTRFTDGGEFGLGAEIGISNQKLHARGPMGLREMTTYKYCIYGDGQIR